MIELLSVGQISKPHGVRGEVKVISLTDSLERFRELDRVYIEGEEKRIISVKLQTDRAILKIEGIDTVEEADKLRNKYLEVTRNEAMQLDEDSYYIADLIQCMVYDTKGNKIGPVYDVIETGSNDVYWVKGEGIKEVLIPALKSIVVSVDIEENKIVIKPIDEWSE